MIAKPVKLGVLRRVSSGAGRQRLWITALGAFDLHTPGDFLTEAQLWQTAAPALAGAVLDAGMPKPHAEVLVAGEACAPRGRAVRSLLVDLELGPVAKRVVVFGPRWWRYGPDGPVMSAPEPFERMRLGWDNAFGGPGSMENPLGKGADARARMGRREPAELPRIETPGALILGIDDCPPPAGLGPRAEDHPARLRFAGTYDRAWLRDDFPDLARDFDARFHNTACPDQQTGIELRGDETYRITSMHPEHTELRGRLPGLLVRAFARRGGTFTELPMRCDTVWLFPNATMGIVFFRAGIEAADRDASDVPHVLLAYERLTDPKRTLAHYETEFDERTHPDTAGMKLFDERPIRPERLPEEVEAAEAEKQALVEERARREEQARTHAMTTALRGFALPPPPPGLFDEPVSPPVEIPVITPGAIRRMEVDVVGLTKSAEALQDYAKREHETQLARAGHELGEAVSRAGAGLDPRMLPLVERELARASKQSGGVIGEMLDAGRTQAAASAHAAPSDAAGKPADAVLPTLDDLFQRAQETLESRAGGTRTPAGASAALRRARNRALGRADEDDPLVQARARVEEAAATFKRGTDPFDVPGFDVPGDKTRRPGSPAASDPFALALQALEREGAAGGPGGQASSAGLKAALDDPRAAWGVDAIRHAAAGGTQTDRGTVLDDDLAEAGRHLDAAREQMSTLEAEARRLSPAPITCGEPLNEDDAKALGALALGLTRDAGVDGEHGLQGRDLAGADLAGADLAGMDLTGIFLEKANLTGANLSRATLRDAVLTDTLLAGANLAGADLTGSNLCGADASHARLGDACLDEARLVRTRLDGADLARVRLKDVTFVETSLDGACLADARIRDCTFLECTLTGVSLDRARLHGVCLLESSTAGLSARAARFERCALIGLDAEEADLTDLEVVDCACIGGAKLARARMAGLVSIRSGWRGADLQGADLTAARLDESDLGETNLTDACLHRASLKRALLGKTTATGAIFYGATLLEAQAQEADFTGASFHMANLHSTDLMGARLRLCDLTGANLTGTMMTRPAGAD